MVITLIDREGRELAHHSNAGISHPSRIFKPVEFKTGEGMVRGELVILIEDEALFVSI